MTVNNYYNGVAGNGEHNLNTVYTHADEIKKYFEESWTMIEKMDDALKKTIAEKRDQLQTAALEHGPVATDSLITDLWDYAASTKAIPGAVPSKALTAHTVKDKENGLGKLIEIQDALFAAVQLRIQLWKALVPADKDKAAQFDDEQKAVVRLMTSTKEKSTASKKSIGYTFVDGGQLWRFMIQNPGFTAKERKEYCDNHEPTKTMFREEKAWQESLTACLTGVNSIDAPALIHGEKLDAYKGPLEKKLGKPVKDPYGQTYKPKDDEWTVEKIDERLKKIGDVDKDYVTGEQKLWKGLKPLSRNVIGSLCCPPFSSSTGFRVCDIWRVHPFGCFVFFLFDILFVALILGILVFYFKPLLRWFYIVIVSGLFDASMFPLKSRPLTGPFLHDIQLNTNDDKQQILFGGALCYLEKAAFTKNVVGQLFPFKNPQAFQDANLPGCHKYWSGKPKEFDGIATTPGLHMWQSQTRITWWALLISYALFIVNDMFRCWKWHLFATGKDLKLKTHFVDKWPALNAKIIECVLSDATKKNLSDVEKQRIEADQKRLKERGEKLAKGLHVKAAWDVCKVRTNRVRAMTSNPLRDKLDPKTKDVIKSLMVPVKQAIAESWVIMPSITFPPALIAFTLSVCELTIISWTLTMFLPVRLSLPQVAKMSNAQTQFGKVFAAALGVLMTRAMIDVYLATGSLMYALHDEFCTARRAWARLAESDVWGNKWVGWPNLNALLKKQEEKTGVSKIEIDESQVAHALAEAAVLAYRERFWGTRYYNHAMDWVWRVATGDGQDEDMTRRGYDIPPIWAVPDIGGQKLKWYMGNDGSDAMRYYVLGSQHGKKDFDPTARLAPGPGSNLPEAYRAKHSYFGFIRLFHR